MNDKKQLAAMGEHMAEQAEQAAQPLCMAKRIEELEAQVRVMVELLAQASTQLQTVFERDPQHWDFHGLVSRIDAALAGKMPSRQLPIINPDWMKAPAWARFWAVDFDGLANWFSHEPEAAMGRWCYQQKRNRQHLVAGSCEIDVKKMKELGLRDWWKDTLAAAPKPEAK